MDNYIGSTPYPVTVANKGLWRSPSKNVIILLLTGILGEGYILCIHMDQASKELHSWPVDWPVTSPSESKSTRRRCILNHRASCRNSKWPFIQVWLEGWKIPSTKSLVIHIPSLDWRKCCRGPYVSFREMKPRESLGKHRWVASVSSLTQDKLPLRCPGSSWKHVWLGRVAGWKKRLRKFPSSCKVKERETTTNKVPKPIPSMGLVYFPYIYHKIQSFM